jgi:GH25 family lysozyme M1 (1,4-beta-N-acetylmuramidase)
VVGYLVDAHTTYQMNLDVSALAREGFDALIVKATEGADGFVAPSRFDSWLLTAARSSLVQGAYHWVNNDNPVTQVRRFLRRCGDISGMFLAGDFEDPADPPSKMTVTAWIEEFFQQTGGHPLRFYTGNWWIDSYAKWLYDFDLTQLGPVTGWNSHYVAGSGYASELYPKVPNSYWAMPFGGFGTAEILQFSSSGRAGGQRVDLNAHRGTKEQLRKGGDMALSEDDIKRIATAILAGAGQEGYFAITQSGTTLGDAAKYSNAELGKMLEGLATGGGSTGSPGTGVGMAEIRAAVREEIDAAIRAAGSRLSA